MGWDNAARLVMDISDHGRCERRWNVPKRLGLGWKDTPAPAAACFGGHRPDESVLRRYDGGCGCGRERGTRHLSRQTSWLHHTLPSSMLYNYRIFALRRKIVHLAPVDAMSTRFFRTLAKSSSDAPLLLEDLAFSQVQISVFTMVLHIT